MKRHLKEPPQLSMPGPAGATNVANGENAKAPIIVDLNWL